MSLEVKDETKVRLSDASTLDMEFSSDEELTTCYEECKIFSPVEAIHLFETISTQDQDCYTDFTEKLQDVLELLDRELEPVCIREERSFSATSVSLSGIINSRLCRRRSTLTVSTN